MTKIAILLAGDSCGDSLLGFPDDAVRFIDMLASVRPGWEFATINVRNGEFPQPVSAHDGYIITGSTESVNGPAPWLPHLFELVRKLDDLRIPLFGSCFGHQAIAKALGGEVSANPFGWSVGVEITEFVRQENWTPAPNDTLRLYSAHEEMVTAIPPGARILGVSDRVPAAVVAVGDHIFSTQYHPEITPEFIAAIVEELAGKLADGGRESREQLKSGADGAVFAEHLAQFFENALQRPACDSANGEIGGRYEFMESLAAGAGQLALDYFDNLQSLTIERKGVQDLVSEADRNVETFIRNEIGRVYPDDGIVGEEHADQSGSSAYTWVIDPIDGTANFLRGIPVWTVSIACVRDGTAVIGALHDPVHKEYFHCRRNHGAFLNGKPISAARGSDLTDGLIGLGTSTRADRHPVPGLIEGLIQQDGMFVRSGSGALGLGYVACGRYLAYMEDYLNSWDCLAGMLLAEEAGAICHDFWLDRMMRNGGRAVVAAPGVFHAVRDLSREFLEN